MVCVCLIVILKDRTRTWNPNRDPPLSSETNRSQACKLDLGNLGKELHIGPAVQRRQLTISNPNPPGVLASWLSD